MRALFRRWLGARSTPEIHMAPRLCGCTSRPAETNAMPAMAWQRSQSANTGSCAHIQHPSRIPHSIGGLDMRAGPFDPPGDQGRACVLLELPTRLQPERLPLHDCEALELSQHPGVVQQQVRGHPVQSGSPSLLHRQARSMGQWRTNNLQVPGRRMRGCPCWRRPSSCSPCCGSVALPLVHVVFRWPQRSRTSSSESYPFVTR